MVIASGESGLADQFFQRPILNSPYERPTLHWELDLEGQPTGNLIEARRHSDLITPVPKPKKRKKKATQTEMAFDAGDDLSSAEQEYNPTPIINEVRQHVDAWRNLGALEHINDDDLKTAGSFCLERGPEPIINSLRGGNALFQKVVLPPTLPDTLDRMDRAQQRWLAPIVHPTDRPPYIGSWNATAMFMTALFSNPTLAATQMEPKPVLPPGGPIFTGLSILHDAGLVTTAPDTAGIDGNSFEPGVLYTNNALLQSLLAGCTGWSLTDVHSGVYLLGTRHHESDSWIKAKAVTA